MFDIKFPLLLALPLIQFCAVQVYVPLPYMDEIFHIPASNAWAAGDYSQDSMITTPPLLYAISSFLPQSVWVLRAVNLVILYLCWGLMWSIVGKRRAAVLATTPILMFFSCLFYTDMLSLLLILTLYTVLREKDISVARGVIAAHLGLLAAAVRQTNILFAAFLVLGAAQPRSLILLLSQKRLCILLVYAVAACIYLKWNNFQVVLGDATAHVPILHLAQLPYAMLFIAGPLVLRKPQSVYSQFNLKRFTLFLVMAFVCVRWGTYFHPYVLADNRHYVFTLTRRLLRPERIRSLMCIPYAVSASLISQLKISQWVLLGWACTMAVVLVPAGIIECRYFIVGAILLRLMDMENSGTTREQYKEDWREIISNSLVSAACVFVFVAYRFYWSGTLDGQRFMW